MRTSQPTSTRRGRALLTATVTLVLATLLGPSAAEADTIRLSNATTFPTTHEMVDMSMTVTAYGDAVASVYSEAGRASCPASAGAAAADGMTLVVSRSVSGDGASHPMAARSWPGSAARYRFCGYVHRGTDTATARGTDQLTVDVEDAPDAPIVTVPARQGLTTANTVTATVSCPRACSVRVSGWAGGTSVMGVPLGAATATIPTFGGSASVALTMTSTQRSWLRSLLAAGDSVQADLYAVASYADGSSYATTASATLSLVSAVPTSPARVFRGA